MGELVLRIPTYISFPIIGIGFFRLLPLCPCQAAEYWGKTLLVKPVRDAITIPPNLQSVCSGQLCWLREILNANMTNLDVP